MILRLFHISRPVLWINTVGPATVGMWLAGDLWRWEALPILLWLTLPFNLLIYGVNDVFDQETDAQNPRKGTLEGARIDRSEVRPIALGVIVSNVPFLIYFALFVPALGRRLDAPVRAALRRLLGPAGALQGPSLPGFFEQRRLRLPARLRAARARRRAGLARGDRTDGVERGQAHLRRRPGRGRGPEGRYHDDGGKVGARRRGPLERGLLDAGHGVFRPRERARRDS